MSTNCTFCNTALTPGTRFCPPCGMAFDQPVPGEQAAPVMPSTPAAASHATKARRPWPAALLVASIGVLGLTIMGCGTQSPPPPPPPPPVAGAGGPVVTTGGTGTGTQPPPPGGNLVGSWASDVVVGGTTQHWVYTFKDDGTVAETLTNQAGQSGTGTGSYTSTNNQVSIVQDSHVAEQASVTWDSADQFHYAITKNDDPSQVGMDAVFVRQSPQATPGNIAATPPPANFTMTSDDLVQAYIDDSAAADAKYKGQMITVSGKVNGEPQASTAFLDTAINVPHSGAYSTYNMECDFTPGTDLSGLAPGVRSDPLMGSFFVSHSVTVEGVCMGRKDDGKVWMDSCTLKQDGSATRVQ